MPIYAYLLRQEAAGVPFDMDTRWTRSCIWLLQNVFGARYWREVVVLQNKQMQEKLAFHKGEEQQLLKKLDYVLRCYAAHVDEPTSSRSWVQRGTGVEEWPRQTASKLFDLSDQEFLEQLQAKEVI